MTKKEWFKFHKEFCAKMIAVTKKKNADYTGASDDPFANFKMVEGFGCVSATQGFFTRMTDKFSRISSFIKKGRLEVADETVIDTLHDLANYCALMAGYLESQKYDKVMKAFLKSTEKKNGKRRIQKVGRAQAKAQKSRRAKKGKSASLKRRVLRRAGDNEQSGNSRRQRSKR